MISPTSPLAGPVRVTKFGDTFELDLPELLLVVRDRDLGRAWATLQRRAESVQGWAAALGLVLPEIQPANRS